MTAGDFAQFIGFFIGMTGVASCLGCLVDRGLIAWRMSHRVDEEY